VVAPALTRPFSLEQNTITHGASPWGPNASTSAPFSLALKTFPAPTLPPQTTKTKPPETHVKITMEGMEARIATKEDVDFNREELIETVEFDLGKALTEVNGKLNTLREGTDNLDSELQILDSSAQGLWDHLEELDNGLGKLEFIAYQRIFIAMVSLVVIQHLLRTVGLIE